MARMTQGIGRCGAVSLALIASVAAASDRARIVADPSATVESPASLDPTSLTYAECVQLDLQYVAARREARACHPRAQVEQCTEVVGDALICPCPTVVSRFNVPALRTMEEAQSVFDAAGCHGFWDCVASFCPGVYGASCADDDSVSKPGSNQGQCVAWGGW